MTGTEEWEAIERRSTEDWLVDLALGRSRRRPPISALPTGLWRDIRASFGSDSSGCRRADDLLSRAGDAEVIDDACRRSTLGKLLPNALYVHRTALEALDPREGSGVTRDRRVSGFGYEPFVSGALGLG